MSFKMKHLNPGYWLRPLLPRTLFARSLLIIVVPVFLLQIIITVVFVDNHWRKVSSRLAFAVAGEVSILSDQIENSKNMKEFARMAAYASRSLDLLVTLEPGRVLTPKVKSKGTWEPFTADALSKAIERQVRRPFTLEVSPQEQWVNIGVQLENGILRVFVLERRLFSSSSYIFLLWMLGSSVILFAIAALFMRNQIRPIHKLAIAAERFGTGRDVPAFKPEGAREVRQAARAFIEMHDRIKRQMEQRTAMLAGISHDLRTPLTRLKLGLSMLGDTSDIEALKGDISDMERMVNSYLDFVRGDGQEAPARINLSDMVDKVAASVRRHGKNISVTQPDNLMVNVRPIAFERCLVNLVSNAEKYGKNIWLDVTQQDKAVHIEIQDNGPGLPKDRYDDVFKPFFRMDTSRNMSTGGVGLGLPIARDIIHAHGGQIHLDKSAHGGLKVILELPV